ncbi:MAG: hypothetical protein A3F09_01965 [Chlamydiae bacterium RIFCSPHIGHO2_12_FULL_49_11]|nr:MAG: hypothetical protein A3F09_01965 [Chlamydiae bacterium RIFCSPHIGHO2_12_FULL_49_11]
MKKNKYLSLFGLTLVLLGAFFLTPLTKLREKYAVLVSKSKPVQKHSVNLEMENRILKDRLNMAAGFLEMEDRIENWVKKFDYSTVMLTAAISKEEFLKRRAKELSLLLEEEIYSLPAAVIYRDPVSYSSTVWINVGERDNRTVGRTVVAKNSPVLVHANLFGVVEEVGEKASKVRLITDSKLHIAVRAVRGGKVDEMFIEHFEEFLRCAKNYEHAEEFIDIPALSKSLSKIKKSESTTYLAKGELCGSGLPLWRTRLPLLRGIGFNYDFADEEGKGAELHTGEVLIRKGDLLVTTGMDGIFPAGIEVAFVSKVFPLREGAIYYEIEADSLLVQFHTVEQVTVFPPIPSRD